VIDSTVACSMLLLGRKLTVPTLSAKPNLNREDIREYVAELQLHMALQARNLTPTFAHTGDSRQQLVHESQAMVEKLVSRQSF
jgi:hypothetical protein